MLVGLVETCRHAAGGVSTATQPHALLPATRASQASPGPRGCAGQRPHSIRVGQTAEAIEAFQLGGLGGAGLLFAKLGLGQPGVPGSTPGDKPRGGPASVGRRRWSPSGRSFFGRCSHARRGHRSSCGGGMRDDGHARLPKREVRNVTNHSWRKAGRRGRSLGADPEPDRVAGLSDSSSDGDFPRRIF